MQQVSLFARHFNRLSELLGPEDIRSYQIYLTNERELAPRLLKLRGQGSVPGLHTIRNDNNGMHAFSRTLLVDAA